MNDKPAKAKANRKPAAKAKTPRADAEPASRRIDARIRELDGWRGDTLARVRALVLKSDPAIVEEWKWSNPVWSRDGIVCTGEAYKQVVKLTFPHGAALPDPAGLFNSSLTGNTRRAIDIREGEEIDAAAFRALVRAAVAHNGSPTKPAKAVKLLSGGNPQIAKADGDAPVQAYIAAMPGWKSAVGKQLDTIIERTVPGVRKAVRWNSPFYGVEGQGWFLGVHCFTKYIKVAFFRGTSLKPLPPGASKSDETRYLDIREGDPLDEAQFAAWAKQAAALPGWKP